MDETRSIYRWSRYKFSNVELAQLREAKKGLTAIDDNRKILIPVRFRRLMGIEKGDEVAVSLLAEGILIKKHVPEPYALTGQLRMEEKDLITCLNSYSGHSEDQLYRELVRFDIVTTICKLGRVTIPQAFVDIFHFTKEQPVTLELVKNGLLLQPYHFECKLCQRIVDLHVVKTGVLCGDCIQAVKEYEPEGGSRNKAET